MQSTRPARAAAVPLLLAIVLIAGAAVVATGAAAPPGSSAGTPSPSPTSPPALPSLPPDDADDGLAEVPLFNWPGVDSRVIVWDETGSLADAVSGQPDRDGPVPYDVIETAASADGESLRLTWSDLPISSRVRLSIRLTDEGKYRIVLFRSRPQEPTDGVVSDRVLDLRFHVAVPAEDVDVYLSESLLPSASVGFVRADPPSSAGAGPSVFVWDETDGLAAASIESVEGASVAPGEVRISNLDEDTLRVKWANPPGAGRARLSIRVGADGTYRFRIVREQSGSGSDTVASDRVVVLDFLVAVRADDVEVELVDEIVNAG